MLMWDLYNSRDIGATELHIRAAELIGFKTNKLLYLLLLSLYPNSIFSIFFYWFLVLYYVSVLANYYLKFKFYFKNFGARKAYM